MLDEFDLFRGGPLQHADRRKAENPVRDAVTPLPAGFQ